MQATSLSSPTVAEARRFRLIQEGGCVVCWHFLGRFRAPEVHHLLLGGLHGQKRRGHAYTVGLCPWHHRGVLPELSASAIKAAVRVLGPSFAKTPNRFREQFGSDDDLLVIQSCLLADVAASYVTPVGAYADPVFPGGLPK